MKDKKNSSKSYINKYSGEIIYAEENTVIRDSEYCYLLSETQLENLINIILKKEKYGNSKDNNNSERSSC